MMLTLIEAPPPHEHSGLSIDHFFEINLQKVLKSSLVRGNKQLLAYIKKWTDPHKAKRKVINNDHEKNKVPYPEHLLFKTFINHTICTTNFTA